MSIFDQNQTREIVFRENCQIWNFFTISLIYICIKRSRKDSSLWIMSGNWNLKETRTGYDLKVFAKDNRRQSIWQKVKISSTIWQNKKNFDICFSVIFDSYCQIIISAGKTGYYAVSSSSLRFSSVFLIY